MELYGINQAGKDALDEVKAQTKAEELLKMGIYHLYGSGFLVVVVLFDDKPAMINGIEPFIPQNNREFEVIFDHNKQFKEIRKRR